MMFENMWFQAVATTYIDYSNIAQDQKYAHDQMAARQGQYGEAGVAEQAPSAFPKLSPREVNAPRR